MYLSIENVTCPKEQISLYLIVLKQFFLLKTVLGHRLKDLNSELVILQGITKR